MGKITNYTRNEWAKAHLDHTFYMTQSAFPYPKPRSPFGANGLPTRAFAFYAFMASFEGHSIDDLELEAIKAADFVRKGKAREYPGFGRLQETVDRLGTVTTAEETLRTLAAHLGRHLNTMKGEVAWCYERNWVRLSPPAKYEIDET